MSDFPLLRLEILCDKITDGTHHSPTNLPAGPYKYITAKNIKPWGLDLSDLTYVDEKTHREIYSRCDVKKDDILYIKDGATTGVAAVNPFEEEFSLLSSVGVLRAGPAIRPRYLLYALQEPRTKNRMMASVAGVAITRLTLRKLNDAEIPVASLATQDRIVAKLEELLSDLDAGVAELKAAQKKLAQYRQSLLKAAVEGALTAEWRRHNPPQETGADLLARILTERRARWEAKQLAKFESEKRTPPKDWRSKYPEPVLPDLAGLPTLPAHWVWASLDMLGDIASGVAKGSKRDAKTVVREAPYLRVANVQRGYLDLGVVKTIEATEADIEELSLENGDVLFNEGGDRDKLGRGWVWRDQIRGCIHQNHVFRMRPFVADLHPEFVSHHGNTFGKLWFQRAGKQTTNLASINMGMLRAFPVPVPPAKEQAFLLDDLNLKIEQLDRQEHVVERALKQSSAQRQNILRAAFAGQLVPQDPNDEPASVLLERIRAERLAQGASSSLKKRGRRQLKELFT